MKNKVFLILIGIVFIVSYFLGNNIRMQYDNKKNDLNASFIKSDCDPTKNTCRLSLSGNVIEYRILGAPSALSEFEVEAISSGDTIINMRVNFSMRNMDMGNNDHTLVKRTGNAWGQKVILPICSLSRNDWINSLEVEYEERLWFIDFSFEQKN